MSELELLQTALDIEKENHKRTVQKAIALQTALDVEKENHRRTAQKAVALFDSSAYTTSEQQRQVAELREMLTENKDSLELLLLALSAYTTSAQQKQVAELREIADEQ